MLPIKARYLLILQFFQTLQRLRGSLMWDIVLVAWLQILFGFHGRWLHAWTTLLHNRITCTWSTNLNSALIRCALNPITKTIKHNQIHVEQSSAIEYSIDVCHGSLIKTPPTIMMHFSIKNKSRFVKTQSEHLLIEVISAIRCEMKYLKYS